MGHLHPIFRRSFSRHDTRTRSTNEFDDNANSGKTQAGRAGGEFPEMKTEKLEAFSDQ
jgi:hypothetical protein